MQDPSVPTGHSDCGAALRAYEQVAHAAGDAPESLTDAGCGGGQACCGWTRPGFRRLRQRRGGPPAHGLSAA
jgi:hypothetical protein